MFIMTWTIKLDVTGKQALKAQFKFIILPSMPMQDSKTHSTQRDLILDKQA